MAIKSMLGSIPGLRSKKGVKTVVVDVTKHPQRTMRQVSKESQRPLTMDTGTTFKTTSSRFRSGLTKVMSKLRATSQQSSSQGDDQAEADISDVMSATLVNESVESLQQGAAALVVDLKAGTTKVDEGTRKPAAHTMKMEHEKPAPKPEDAHHFFLDLPKAKGDMFDVECPRVKVMAQSAEYRHDSLITQAYGAFKGEPSCRLLIQTMAGWRRLPPTANPFVVIDNVRCPMYRHDMTAESWKWIQRVELSALVLKKHRSRELSDEDADMILENLFPDRASSIWQKPMFDINLEALHHEHVFTRQQCALIARLRIAVEDLTWTAPVPAPSKHLPTFHALPVGEHSTIPAGRPFSAPRTYQLAALCEAAVYNCTEWLGARWLDARGTLARYIDAQRITDSGWGTPPDLTPYKRNFNTAERRMLRGAALVLDLQRRFDAGAVTDFAVIKALRGCYFGTPTQLHLSSQALASYLYDRVVGSGVAVDEVPAMLLLHPDFDDECRRGGGEARVRARLIEQADEFKELERRREEEVKAARAAMREAKIGAMKKRQRVASKMRKMLACESLCGGREHGREEEYPAFNPYDEKHEEEKGWRWNAPQNRDWSMTESEQ